MSVDGAHIRAGGGRAGYHDRPVARARRTAPCRIARPLPEAPLCSVGDNAVVVGSVGLGPAGPSGAVPRRPGTSGARPIIRPTPRVGARPAVRRTALVGAFAVLLAACAVWVQGGGGRAGSDPLNAPGTGRTATVAAHLWVVQPGDTLWAIARRLDPNGDIRPLVDALSREVHGRPLQVGQQIVLP